MNDKDTNYKSKMDDKFILMGLDDENSKAVADILGNATCKKILNFLADVKEASEKDIADGLGIKINTVEYNLKKLIKLGLVEKSKNFFWSVKGKRILMYKLARKHIIISNKKPSLSYIKSIIPVILIAAFLAVILAWILMFPPTNEELDQTKLKQFKSFSELENFLKEYSETEGFGGLFRVEEAAVVTSAESKADDSGSGAGDYSTTNIQVEGVDEPDIMKNDGKYIYTVSGNKVVIVDAFPAEKMKVLSEIEFEESVSKVFINKNKLIVFAGGYDYGILQSPKHLTSSLYPDYRNYGNVVFIYNVEDRENPELEDKIVYDGSYVDSRMINKHVYIVSTKYANIKSPEPPVYISKDTRKEVQAEEVYYFDYPDSSYVFTSIMAVDIESGELNSKVYLTGATSTIYVSQDNIYLTYQKRMDYKNYLEDFVDKVALPILPEEYDEKVKYTLKTDEEDAGKLKSIMKLIEDYSQSLKGDERAEFDEKLMELTEEFQTEIQKKMEKTIIHKINVDKNEIGYKGVGEVPGMVLNQFSMSEYKGDFRIATTTGNVWSGNSLNHIYVLNEDLEVVGGVENLAEGERIYSARFLRDRAYLVTFKNVDPLFVVDLSDPENPKVLGYLKITGYSDYLHIYDEDHVIGIGKETRGGDEQFSWYQGVKISLFDVSDVENPVEKAKLEIGDRGTDSDALYDPHAFLFDKEKNLLVIPIRLAEINIEQYGQVPVWAYGDFVWQGAYVFDIDLDGIELKGRISHDDNQSSEDKSRYWYNTNVKRSLYMDDVLYTVSDSKIKANELSDLDEISEVEWGFKEEPIYYAEAGRAI